MAAATALRPKQDVVMPVAWVIILTAVVALPYLTGSPTLDAGVGVYQSSVAWVYKRPFDSLFELHTATIDASGTCTPTGLRRITRSSRPRASVESSSNGRRSNRLRPKRS